MSRLLRCCVLVLVLAGTACGSQPPADPAAPAPAGDGAHSGHGPVNDPSAPVVLFAVDTAPLGVVATDGGGRLLYRSDADSASPPVSNCADPCTATWTPLLIAEGQKLELAGVNGERVGRLPRADGSIQVTLAGWPLYVRPDDDGQLRTAGSHGAGGWWAVTPTGDRAAGT